MGVFELVLGLLLGGVGLVLLAPSLGAPWPTLLALGGAALAFVPGMPVLALDPRLALALFVAPVIMDAAYDASPRDLRDNWFPLGSLVLGAVALTVIVVAATARRLDPGLPWAAALALGAIVAPPDAAAATAVLRQVRLPHRLMVILEGEGLLNDASALLIYRVAVSTALGGITLWTVPLAALGAVAGVALGVALARPVVAVIARVPDGPAVVLLQFLGTFGVWLLADALDLSAVLTVIAYATAVSRFAEGRMGPRQRRASYAVWEVAVFVLNVLAFVLVGSQLRGILLRVDGQAWHYAAFSLAVFAATVLARFAWVLPVNTVIRWKIRRFGTSPRRPLPLPTLQGGVVIAWCGMRGMVTLAAALAVPDGFPERDLIVAAAFCTVLGTLVVQGFTLRPMLARLSLPQDESVEDEVALARTELARAALVALEPDSDTEAGRLLARKYGSLSGPQEPEADRLASSLGLLRRRTMAAQRASLMALRRSDRIGDEAFRRLEEEFDWAEMDLESPRD